MVEQKKKAAEAAVKSKVKKPLTYSQVLEARSQRGSMTYQKRFAIKKVKEKEMKEN